jgi:hypothetical protein
MGFSSTAEPVPTATPVPWERMTAPWASRDPSPRRAVPDTTAERAMCTESARTSPSPLPGPKLIDASRLVPRQVGEQAVEHGREGLELVP